MPPINSDVRGHGKVRYWKDLGESTLVKLRMFVGGLYLGTLLIFLHKKRLPFRCHLDSPHSFFKKDA